MIKRLIRKILCLIGHHEKELMQAIVPTRKGHARRTVYVCKYCGHGTPFKGNNW